MPRLEVVKGGKSDANLEDAQLLPKVEVEEQAGIDPEFAYLMNAAIRRVRSTWDIATEQCELGPSDTYFLVLNALQFVAAEKHVPVPSMDTYLRYMANNPDSYLNMLRNGD